MLDAVRKSVVFVATLGTCLLCRADMPLGWKLLALLGNVLAYHVACATHSPATRQPAYTSARKIHTGRAVRAEHYSHSGKLADAMHVVSVWMDLCS